MASFPARQRAENIRSCFPSQVRIRLFVLGLISLSSVLSLSFPLSMFVLIVMHQTFLQPMRHIRERASTREKSPFVSRFFMRFPALTAVSVQESCWFSVCFVFFFYLIVRVFCYVIGRFWLFYWYPGTLTFHLVSTIHFGIMLVSLVHSL